MIDETKQKELETLLDILIDLFKPISEWHLSLVFIDSIQIGDITGDNTSYGVTSYRNFSKSATIYINIDAVYEEWDCPECTLIHELVHILNYNLNFYCKTTKNCEDDRFYTMLLEQFCNTMSYGIFNCLKHNNK